MTDTTTNIYIRPEFEVSELETATNVDVERRLSLIDRISNINAVRKFTILLGLVAIWEIYTRIGDVEPLLFPTFSDSAVVLWETLLSGVMLEKVWVSLYVLVLGYIAGVVLAAAFLVFAVMSRIGSDFLSTMTAMFQPLPAISLLPLAMLWFGLGVPSLVFVTIHSVLWAVALSTHTGFMQVSETLRMVGRNYGLRGIPYVFMILVPAAFASILTGLKVGWAFAWRTLIGAELVFGAASGEGGLGWMIYEKGDNLETPYVFAALFTVIVIGLIVENLIFRNVEISTVQKWGMQR
ncbi:MAG: ABC transporter permease [Alphaproteobacteria bacterium]|nr:ABC transporter permease [Alphaproteobacteria bacterium]|tara:strand:+ start:1360 stop:2241 length:882 start_codon:yes stop_codon:yes gene_type:complete